MATSTSMRRKLLGLIMLGAKMNENHDDKGRFTQGESSGDREGRSGSGGKKPLGYTPLSNEESGARHEAEKLREHLGTAGSGSGSDAAKNASWKARNASADADRNERGSADLHNYASKLHNQAADLHRQAAISNPTLATEHTKMAAWHDAMAHYHSESDTAYHPGKVPVSNVGGRPPK